MVGVDDKLTCKTHLNSTCKKINWKYITFGKVLKYASLKKLRMLSGSRSINPFYSNVTFLCPQKLSENHRFSDVFRGYRNVTLDKNGLIIMNKLLKRTLKIVRASLWLLWPVFSRQVYGNSWKKSSDSSVMCRLQSG